MPVAGAFSQWTLTCCTQYPFLMHASLAVALTYDRHLSGSSTCRRSPEECYHWHRSTVLLNRQLRHPIRAEDKDPIWGAAAALAILTVSSPDASTPHDAWPLKSSPPSDLDWVRMSHGKMSLWHLVNPLRPDSLFRVMAPTFADMDAPLPARGIDGIPAPLAALCGLHPSCTAEENPYFAAAHTVSHLLLLPSAHVTTGLTQLFPRCIAGRFEDLLRGRDPRALVLLYLWYCKAGRCVWWIELRARVEGPAICGYLRRFHAGRAGVLAFLPGGAFADEWSG